MAAMSSSMPSVRCGADEVKLDTEFGEHGFCLLVGVADVRKIALRHGHELPRVPRARRCTVRAPPE